MTEPNPTGKDGSMRDRFDEFADRVESAAIEAEYATGEREATEEEAKRGALFRAGRMALGTLVTLIGIAALPLPGPGWLIIAGGLTILSNDVAWADRLLRVIRRKVPGVPEDGKIPRSSMITIAFMTCAAVAFSMWWTFARGSDAFPAGTYEATDTTATIVLADDGAATVSADGCEPVELAASDVSKTEVTFGDASSDCDGLSEIVGQLAGQTVTLDYSTDGYINWFLANDYLSALQVGDTTIAVADSTVADSTDSNSTDSNSTDAED